MRKILLLLVACAACSSAPHKASPDAPPAPPWLAHSSSIAISSDGATVFVVNADADSVSLIDTKSRTLTAEVLLAGAHPAVDASGNYTPAVQPRALALSPDGATLWVTGERASALYAVDVASHAVSAPIQVGSEPVGVVVSADGKSVFVACSQDGTVVKVDAASHMVVATAQVGGEPWALGFTATGTLVTTEFQGPGLIPIDPASMMPMGMWGIPDTAPRGDKRLAHGEVRGEYDVAARPGTSELWTAHLMLGIDTPQPDLDFESTVFPSLSIVSDAGAYQTTLSTDAQDVPGVDGSFADVVSGPHSIAFTHDGAYALVADTDSEDVLGVDARGRVEAALLRPLPGHQPEGIVLAPDDSVAYVDERNTADIAVIAVDRTSGLALSVSGATIPRLTSDPMPQALRFGQQLFYSANSDEFPLTRNHWVACTSCHLEGRSDAVTWKFTQGPRDTPTNAGGMMGTGYLFRTADRLVVQDYWRTIDTEQGGTLCMAAPTGTPPTTCTASDMMLLNAIEDYVDHAIPLPIPPTTDPVKVARGKQIFEDPAVKCSTCHAGPHFTDSGGGTFANPTSLHDVGTCVTTGFPDVAHTDIDGDPRAACMFDTPSLLGVASTPPYLHDGSAPTLHAVLEATRGKMGDITMLSPDDEDALVEYLRSL